MNYRPDESETIPREEYRRVCRERDHLTGLLHDVSIIVSQEWQDLPVCDSERFELLRKLSDVIQRWAEKVE